MDQHQATTRTPLPRRVVRLLVLAGAAIVWWLLISGGPAQADDTATDPSTVADAASAAAVPTPQIPTVNPAAQVAPGVAEENVKTATAPLRDLPQQTARTVRQATAAAPEPVRQTAQQLATTLEPTLASTTGAVADAVDQTATRVGGALVDPVLQSAGLEAAQSATSTPSVATTGRTTAHEVSAAAPEHRLSIARDAALRTFPQSPSAAAADGGTSLGADLPAGDHGPGAPDLPGAPSSSSAGAAVAVLAGLMVLAPALLRRSRRLFGDLLPAGPTYAPGSSPG